MVLDVHKTNVSCLGRSVLQALRKGKLSTPKGPVFTTASLAGVMAAKRTADLIPLCHPLPIDDCQVSIRIKGTRILIEGRVTTTGKTGVEMEALTAVSVAALTVYDMCKALSHDIVIEEIRLTEKRGGKSDFRRTRR